MARTDAIWAIAGCAALLGGCAAGFFGPLPEDVQLNNARGAEYETGRIATLEPQALAFAKARATRESGSLHLKLSGGDVLNLQNGAGDCSLTAADCLHYIFTADLPARHAFLVLEARYEGGDWILIDDRTGMRTKLDAVPVFSPDNERLLILSQNEAYGGFFGIEIWRRMGDAAVREWSHSLAGDAPEFGGAKASCPAETFAENAAWRGNRRIAFELHSSASFGCAEASWPSLIEYGPGGWRLLTAWPRAR